MSISRRRFAQEFKDELCREVIEDFVQDQGAYAGIGA